MTQWFGRPWPETGRRSPTCGDDSQQVLTPVGEPCGWCEEPIEEGDRGLIIPGITEGLEMVDTPWHRECFLRSSIGGPGHFLGACLCSGMDCDPDLGMSLRQAAVLVWRLYHQLDDPAAAGGIE